ncbi:MAG: hypothetical protein L3K17_06310 [Thermoplasmata archaeon]|nr:hypothetical protein [Thermoplasmata archaeon]
MGLIVAAVVVVVLVVVVGAIYAAGVGPFAKSTSGPGSTGGSSGETFSQAAASGGPSTDSVAGAPWTLIGGSGEALTQSFTVNYTDLNLSSTGGCTGASLSGASSITAFPGTTAAPSSGDAAGWLLLYVDGAGAELSVAVLGGVATPYYKANGVSPCSVGYSNVLTLPASHVDSPQAASVAWASGGSVFARAHPKLDTSYNLVPAISATVGGFTTNSAAFWAVSMTNCAAFGTSSATLDGNSPATFLAQVNATTGTLLRALNVTTGCTPGSTGGGGGGGAKPTLSSTSYIYFSQQNTTATMFWNNGSLIVSGSYSLTLSDLTVSLKNTSTGAAVSTSGDTLQIINGTSVSSTYTFASNTWSVGSVAIGSFSDVGYMSLTSSMSLLGDSIVLTATSAAPCTGAATATLGGP